MIAVLIETPTLDDLGSSTIEHDIMRPACANGWLVDGCRGAADRACAQGDRDAFAQIARQTFDRHQ
jgi:hypothetical protein